MVAKLTANLVAKLTANLVAKNDANLGLPPSSHSITIITILELRAELMGLHKLNLKDLNKWAETILLERRQTKSVGWWDSRSTFLRSDWPRPFARREVGVRGR
ncbi:hypothetical protein TNCV_1647791 [Trichonephila clavipes]|uniref:Uncharacterized protein n=1 Tax=Trichonephila clavipes TaxID=2585209 RepID=A0A8X6RQ32_TRICX|nr:hypothetical protein TNCV_1647791 [Trichonephila clavipes]